MIGDSSPPVVGILTAELHSGASSILWPALVLEAQRRGISLISFPGGRLGTTHEAFLRNEVYRLAGPGCLDGLISWASSLGGIVSLAELDEFHTRFRGLPMVTLSQQLPGVPMVWIDAYPGMRGLISHLVEVHGYRKIAFIRAPQAHQSAQIRYRAYADALADHGITPDPGLEVGPLPWNGGAEAIRVLVDERGLVPGKDFEALATASDLLAFGAFTALQARGYRIPQDVALVGFNGTVESILSRPHLTTVHQPFHEQGKMAVDQILAMIRGERSSRPETSLPTRLIVRESCGCPPRSTTLARFADGARGPKESKGPAEAVAGWVGQVSALGDFQPDQVAAYFGPLGQAVLVALQDPTQSSGVFEALDRGMAHAVKDRENYRFQEWTAWQDVVSLLKTLVPPTLAPEVRPLFDGWIDQCRVRISAFVEQDAITQAWEDSQRDEALREAGRALAGAWTIGELGLALDQVLPRLGIPRAWLVLTEDPESGCVSADGTGARLVWARVGTKAWNLPAGGLAFARAELVPPSFLPPKGPWSLVVETLYFQDRSVGYMVFQTGPLAGSLYDELRSDISNSLKGIFLMAQVARARQQAEKADQIKTRLLANVSHELRTPLTQILAHVRQGQGADGSKERDLIRQSAEHQLRLINDLLDLSRAEIEELDLNRVLLDPGKLLSEVFLTFEPEDGPVHWRLEVADSLPHIQADPLRLKQILVNLMSNAAKFTAKGTIVVGARAEPPHLRFWVSDTGPGISPELRTQIFQPFVTGDHSGAGGIGLGLSITRHLVSLHYGSIDLESTVGVGSTFHVRFPLPNLEDSLVPNQANRQPTVVILSRQPTVPRDLADWIDREGLTVQFLGYEGTVLPDLSQLRPRCVCWDLTDAQPRDWALVRQLRHHAGLYQAPFLLYGNRQMTVLVDKADQGSSLKLAIEAACPPGGTRPVFVIDDEESGRQAAHEVVSATLPGYPVQTYNDGPSAWEALADEVPSLVILDFSMPGMDGAELLDLIRSDQRLRTVPVLLLSRKVFSTDDVKRIEKHAQVVLQSKGIWDPQEAGEAVLKLLSGKESSPVHTSALVKRAMAYMSQHYPQAVSRWQVAEAVNVSEDYLSRVFSRELGLSPWDFLTRYRIQQACRYLGETSDSIRTIAIQVGFNDQAYFSRVFRKIMGCTPQEFRQKN